MVSFKARHLANCQVMRMVLATWFDRLKESSSCKEIQFKKFFPLVKISCLPAENVNETPGAGLSKVFEGQSQLRPFRTTLMWAIRLHDQKYSFYREAPPSFPSLPSPPLRPPRLHQLNSSNKVELPKLCILLKLGSGVQISASKKTAKSGRK